MTPTITHQMAAGSLSPAGGGRVINHQKKSNGGGYNIERTASSAYKEQHIKKLLEARLKKLGSIRTTDAWQICRSHYPYGVIQFHFKCIMHDLKDQGKADAIKNGHWFIHKN